MGWLRLLCKLGDPTRPHLHHWLLSPMHQGHGGQEPGTASGDPFPGTVVLKAAHKGNRLPGAEGSQRAPIEVALKQAWRKRGQEGRKVGVQVAQLAACTPRKGSTQRSRRQMPTPRKRKEARGRSCRGWGSHSGVLRKLGTFLQNAGAQQPGLQEAVGVGAASPAGTCKHPFWVPANNWAFVPWPSSAPKAETVSLFSTRHAELAVPGRLLSAWKTPTSRELSCWWLHPSAPPPVSPHVTEGDPGYLSTGPSGTQDAGFRAITAHHSELYPALLIKFPVHMNININTVVWPAMNP